MKISIDTDKNSVIITQKFNVKLQLIWDLYTQSEHLDKYWAPEPWQTKTNSMDFREGGAWIYLLTNTNGEQFAARLDYFQIHPLKRFKAVDSFCEADFTADESTPRSIWEVSFESVKHETVVTEVITFASAYHLNATLEMGFEQGVKLLMHNLKSSLHATNIKM